MKQLVQGLITAEQHIREVRRMYDHPQFKLNGYKNGEWFTFMHKMRTDFPGLTEKRLPGLLWKQYNFMLDFRPDNLETCRTILREMENTFASVRHCMEHASGFSGDERFAGEKMGVYTSWNTSFRQPHGFDRSLDALTRRMKVSDDIRRLIVQAFDITGECDFPLGVVTMREDNPVGLALCTVNRKNKIERPNVAGLEVDCANLTTHECHDIAERMISKVVHNTIGVEHPESIEDEEGICLDQTIVPVRRY